MKTLLRAAFSRLALSGALVGGALVFAGCGGGGGGSSIGTPSPTPGGSGPIQAGQIVFVSTRSGRFELYKAAPDGTGAVQLSTIGQRLGLEIERPAVSPDGTRIAFQIDNLPNSQKQLGIINTDGTGYKQLTGTANPTSNLAPVFLDGNTILFTRTTVVGNADTNPHICSLNLTTNIATQIIQEKSAFASVDRTGTLLAYSDADDPNYASTPIALYDRSQGKVIRRLGSKATAGSPISVSLSPDGTKVAYTATTGPNALQLQVLSTASDADPLAKIDAGSGTSSVTNAGQAWGADSQTLFFDAKLGATANLQIYKASPFTASPTPLTTDAQGLNSSPAFLPVSSTP